MTLKKSTLSKNRNPELVRIRPSSLLWPRRYTALAPTDAGSAFPNPGVNTKISQDRLELLIFVGSPENLEQRKLFSVI